MVTGCLAPLAASLAIYVSWVSWPTVPSAAQASQVLQQQQQAFKADQKEATNPSKNAFIDPELSRFWGRKSVEFQEKSRASLVASSLRDFGFLSGNQRASVTDLWNRKDEGLVKAVRDFEAFLPTLERALAHPLYILPQTSPPTFDSEIGNLMAHRTLAQALSAYAEVQLARGRPDGALQACLQIFQLSKLLISQRSHSLMNAMVSSAVQTTGQETLAYVLQSTNLKPEQLRPWLELLANQWLTDEVELDCAEFELWTAQNFFQHPPKSVPMGRLAFFPGVWSREWRLFQNDYLSVLNGIRTHQPATLGWAGSFGAGNWVLGQHSWFTALLMPDYSRVGKLFELAHQRQDFLRLYVRLLLERPVCIESEWLGSLKVKGLTYRLENGKPHLSYKLPSDLVSQLPTPQPGPACWQSLMLPLWEISP